MEGFKKQWVDQDIDCLHTLWQRLCNSNCQGSNVTWEDLTSKDIQNRVDPNGIWTYTCYNNYQRKPA